MNKKKLLDKVVLLKIDNSIDEAIRIISEKSKNVKHPGFAVIVDKTLKLLGVITDGDIRRAYVNQLNFNNSVSSIMKKKPIVIFDEIKKENYLSEIDKLLENSEDHNSNWIRFIPIVNGDKKVLDIIDYFDLIKEGEIKFKNVTIFGMGYVGLTLAGALANRGHIVYGIDSNKSLINRLNKNEIHIHEPGLKEITELMLSKGKIKFYSSIQQTKNNVFIIAVGTPINKSLKPDLSSLIQVLNSIGPKLQKGDQVMLRSTVPLGTTRNEVKPLLEKLSDLKAGLDFHLAFAPERTIEGNAMQELYSLPQIVGGYSDRCTKKAINFWSSITSTVVKVSSIEAAELVKLANNTFRDLSFAFSNNLSILADKYNINGFELINAANKGYLRNPIPLPSPGVGGYCLTKDPILYDSSFDGVNTKVKFGKWSRISNNEASRYPVQIIKKYSMRIGKKLKDFKILIVGLAFKGYPETKDIRESVALGLIEEISPLVKKIFVWDAIVDKKIIESKGFNHIDNVENMIDEIDAIIIMNNHKKNAEINFNKNTKCLIFDGWNQFDPSEIEQIDGLTYSTMGYITPKK